MRILYVTTISNTVNAFLIPHIKMLIEQGHQVDVAFNIVQDVSQELIKLGSKVYNIEFQRSPLNLKNVSAYKKIKKLIKSGDYNLIHTHTPVASFLVRLACKDIPKLKVIYTAHGFHFYKGAPLKNWLLYYPIEKWLSKYTDILITINKEDYARAKRSFRTREKIIFIPGVGLDLNKFKGVSFQLHKKRLELGIPKDAFLLLSVGELNKNKNHELVIKSLAKISDQNIHYLICGQGSLEEYLHKLIKKLKLTNQVHLLGYRKDINEIYKISDLFVFPSIREGLSVALMEAMVSGLPVICSKIRGNVDLIEDGVGGYLFNLNKINELKSAIMELKNDFEKSETFGKSNMKKIQDFSLDNVKDQIKFIYNDIFKKQEKN